MAAILPHLCRQFHVRTRRVNAKQRSLSLAERAGEGYDGWVKGFLLIALILVLEACATGSTGTKNSLSPADRVVAQSPATSTEDRNGENEATGQKKVTPVGQSKQSESASTSDKQPPLGRAQLLKLALAESPSNTYPVRKGGEPLAIVTDLDRDGLNDVALLSIATDKPEEAQFSVLSRLSRLFIPDAPVPTFYLEVYKQQHGGVHLSETIPLGKKRVLEGLTVRRIDRKAAGPVAVVASFQNHDGEEQEWAIFTDSTHFSRFSLLETPNVRTVVRDIDNDGVLDILVFHTGIEAGIGYETFITWFKYKDGSYQEYRSTNVVRNLRAFLTSARETIESGDWKSFLNIALDPLVLRGLRSRGVPDGAIISALFTPAPIGAGSEPPFDYYKPAKAIQNIVFPEIRENPFSSPGRSLRFSMTVRVICCAGESHFYTATISMDPFGRREFSFDPGQGLIGK